MDEGKFDPQLAWLAPARKAKSVPDDSESVDFKDSGPKLAGGRRRESCDARSTDSQTWPRRAPIPMWNWKPMPADAWPARSVVRAVPVADSAAAETQFFERLFGVRPKPAPPPTPPPVRQRPVPQMKPLDRNLAQTNNGHASAHDLKPSPRL